jgi:DNA modification methylase
MFAEELNEDHTLTDSSEQDRDVKLLPALIPYANKILEGDSRLVLPTLPPHSVDLIVTSPPYAKQRSKTYGGVDPDKYVEWFLPISEGLKNVLKPTGSFILNIKEPAVNGERHTFVLELILALKKQGWLWTEEYCWHKKNSFPGKWSNRFRDGWERCLHFNLEKKFAMYQESVMVPMGDWADSRLKKLSETDKRRDNSKVGSPFGKKISNWVGREMAYPDNVLHMATECANRGHSAAYPVDLPSWFIKLFTQPNDVVLDPFMGSGTTAVACKTLDRNYIGIEIDPEYIKLAEERVANLKYATAIESKESSNGKSLRAKENDGVYVSEQIILPLDS